MEPKFKCGEKLFSISCVRGQISLNYVYVSEICIKKEYDEEFEYNLRGVEPYNHGYKEIRTPESHLFKERSSALECGYNYKEKYYNGVMDHIKKDMLESKSYEYKKEFPNEYYGGLFV
jgi:hypothetical protein